MTDVVTFSHECGLLVRIDGAAAISSPSDEGEQLTVEQCLYGVFLQSANDWVSYRFGRARWTAPCAAFAQQPWNQRAGELGCTDTHFVNANGLHDPNHYTTAYDMAA